MGERCQACKKEIPKNACQQGQLIDGVWYPLHVGCAEGWLNEIVPAWTVDWEGDLGHTEISIDTITAYIAELEEGDEITIHRRADMKRIEYLKLPEVM